MKKGLSQKFFGAYYTRPEITAYLCKRTIHSFILQKINAAAGSGSTRDRRFSSMEALLANLDAQSCRELLAILPAISILDPACGPGAFLVAALDTLTGIYEAITSSSACMRDPHLARWLEQARAGHGNLTYSIKKKIIGENLFGVDIMEEAVEMAKLRLYHALASSVQDAGEVEPLTAIDFNIRAGNALIGLLRLSEDVTDRHLSYLNRVLFDEFNRLGVKYEQSTWDSEKQGQGKSTQRALTIDDIESLHPFHWGHEFPQVMNECGGFDIIITNPPWEIFKPQGKEFLATHSEGPNCLPLYEGKMIHQFAIYRSMATLAQSRYWVREQQGRNALLGRKSDSGQALDYQCYRLAYRSIGRTTDQRALIATILPNCVFAGNSLFISRRLDPQDSHALIEDCELLYLAAILNSFLADYFIGQKISANLNMFYIYQLPVPRLAQKDKVFRMIVERAARLICTTAEYRELWETVMPGFTWSPDVVAIDPAERAALRAELDGLIAHLYNITAEEFRHILEAFPLVEQSVKAAALHAYHVSPTVVAGQAQYR